MTVNLVVALAAESRPLIDHFRLFEDRSVAGFRVFQGDGLRLIVTGVGRVACAAGVATLGATAEHGASAWLNVGVAGHGRRGYGEAVHALSIREGATDRRWYPAQLIGLPGDGEALCTVDIPQTTYPEPYTYEMEASAFYPTALRYATSELVQVYKIISDGRDGAVETVTKQRVTALIASRLADIESIVSGLSRLVADLNAVAPKRAELNRITQRWRFTVSRQHQLHELLRQWEVLRVGRPVLDDRLRRCTSAVAVLAEIQHRLAEIYRGSSPGRSQIEALSGSSGGAVDRAYSKTHD